MATHGETMHELLPKQDSKCSSGYLRDTTATTKLAGRDQQAVTSRLAPPKATPLLAPAYTLAANGTSLAQDTLLPVAAPATPEELAQQQPQKQSRSLKKTLKQAVNGIMNAVCRDQSGKDCDASYDPRDDVWDKFAVRRSKWRGTLCACVIYCTNVRVVEHAPSHSQCFFNDKIPCHPLPLSCQVPLPVLELTAGMDPFSTDGVPAVAAITETLRCAADDTPGQALCILRCGASWGLQCCCFSHVFCCGCRPCTQVAAITVILPCHHNQMPHTLSQQ
jgi:hypothetical protein